jgi:hypothetical protein
MLPAENAFGSGWDHALAKSHSAIGDFYHRQKIFAFALVVQCFMRSSTKRPARSGLVAAPVGAHFACSQIP